MKTEEKCPVCDWKITGGGIKIKVGAKEITVCSNECAQKVKEDPARYGEPAS